MYICKETFFEDSKYNDQFKLLKQKLNFNFKIGTNTTCTLYMIRSTDGEMYTYNQLNHHFSQGGNKVSSQD